MTRIFRPIQALVFLLLPLLVVGCSDTLMTQDGGSQPAVAMVSIDPVVGVPEAQSTPMLQSLIARLQANGITAAQSQTGTEFIYKGYLSSVPSADGNTIVHVWDLFDATGNRVHRVNGTVPVPAEGAGPALQEVANQAADGLATYLKAQGR